jgi:hypothetical protein
MPVESAAALLVVIGAMLASAAVLFRLFVYRRLQPPA